MTNESVAQSAAQQQNKVTWSFPDLSLHQPNTESITDAELKQAVISKWPADKNGIVKIPYRYSGGPYFGQPYEGSIPAYLNYGIKPVNSCGDSAYLNKVKGNIENGLKSWEAASNGKIQFYEDKLGLHSSGISFYLADEASLLNEHIRAFTQIKMDNHGYLDQVSIVYPDSQKFWDVNGKSNVEVAKDVRTIVHEEGHGAIGFDHPHSFENIRANIKNMPDGVFASVMPYQFLIKNEKNRCHPVPDTGDQCNPSHATLPGPLDERFVQMNYKDNIPPERGLDDYYIQMNVKNAALGSSISSGAHQGIYSFASNLALQQPEVKTFSDNTAHLIADGAMLAGMAYLGFPLLSLGAYAVGAGMKYLPEGVTASITDKIPEPIKAVYNSPYTSVITNIGPYAWAVYQGKDIVPMIATQLANDVGGKVGEYVGDKVGKANAYVTNTITNKVSQGLAYLSPFPNDEDYVVNTNEVNADKTLSSQENESSAPSPSQNQSMFSSAFSFFKTIPSHIAQGVKLEEDKRSQAEKDEEEEKLNAWSCLNA